MSFADARSKGWTSAQRDRILNLWLLCSSVRSGEFATDTAANRCETARLAKKLPLSIKVPVNMARVIPAATNPT